MPKTPEHCKACLDRFGRDFKEVHEWFDYYYGKKGIDEKGVPYDYSSCTKRHRGKRHLDEGLEECVRLFGEEAREAATLHLLQDGEEYPNPEYRGRVLSRNDFPMVFWRYEP
jgi:hypothetical protein